MIIIIYYDKHWNTEWLTVTSCRIADSAVSEIENRHRLEVKENDNQFINN